MNYRELGRTGLMVSEIGLGCEGLAGDECRLCAPMLDAAEQCGINYIDMYLSNPDLRSAIGKAIRGRRDKFILQGHLCAAWKDGQYVRTRNLAEVKESFEDMLCRLETDFIDVGMIHYCDAESDWQTILDNGILDYAKNLRSRGVIKHIGLSSHNPLIAKTAIQTGEIEVLMFSVNPCYDMIAPSEDVEELWADEVWSNHYDGMNPERRELYELCQRMGVGISVMKCFAGGDLLSADLSPFGAGLTPVQCMAYALSRPAVSVIMSGARTVEEVYGSAAYEDATEEEKDFAETMSRFPRASWSGHCMYCGHCSPCPKHISVADVTKFLNLAKTQNEIPETVREHYKVLPHHAEECIECGACEKRCPFDVKVIANMREAKDLFGF